MEETWYRMYFRYSYCQSRVRDFRLIDQSSDSKRYAELSWVDCKDTESKMNATKTPKLLYCVYLKNRYESDVLRELLKLDNSIDNEGVSEGWTGSLSTWECTWDIWTGRVVEIVGVGEGKMTEKRKSRICRLFVCEGGGLHSRKRVWRGRKILWSRGMLNRLVRARTDIPGRMTDT